VNPTDSPTGNTPATALVVKSADTEPEVKACWSDSGVYGDGSCPELPKFIHCRNCPVYSDAGLRLMDRSLPSNYRTEWTQHFAKEKSAPEIGNSSAVMFRIQSIWLALPTHHFQEIAEKRPIHSVPNRPGGIVLGLANVRGELVTCVSLAHLLQIERTASLETVRIDYQRLLVVVWETCKLAFPVHEVHGPHRFHPQQLKDTPATTGLATPRYTPVMLDWENRAVGLLDAGLLLSNLNLRLG
jgi:chemotaxis-related protein WspD